MTDAEFVREIATRSLVKRAIKFRTARSPVRAKQITILCIYD
jgi:hypothetical protein